MIRKKAIKEKVFVFACSMIAALFIMSSLVNAESVNKESKNAEVVRCKVVIKGYFKGIWGYSDGSVGGTLNGIYGVAKYENKTVNFFKGRWRSYDSANAKSGYLYGEYRDGKFKGVWRYANGKVGGRLEGIYGRNEDGRGYFKGIWKSNNGEQSGFLKGVWKPIIRHPIIKMPNIHTAIEK